MLAGLPAVVLLVWLFLIAGCGGNGVSAVKIRLRSASPQVSELFGLPGYSYAPSVIADGNFLQVWWCGYGAIPGTTFQTDVIYYRTRDTATGAMSTPQIVFWPEPGQWDGRYTCDPSVIRGRFQSGGQDYSYALYYTATDRTDGTNNRIGVAFSNDGVTWSRYAQNPVIYPHTFPTSSYGAGQAATCNRDGAGGIVLFHTDHSGGGVLVRASSDGINFSAPAALPRQGAIPIQNNDFAYDPEDDSYYGAIELPVKAGDRETSGFGLYRMPASQLLAGTGAWEQLASVGTATTGAHLNHSPGLVRDGFGNLEPQRVEVYFARGTNDPNTWTLYSVRWK